MSSMRRQRSTAKVSPPRSPCPREYRLALYRRAALGQNPRGKPTMTTPLERELARFDPKIPIERALTPPASWYVLPEFLAHERDRVFRRTWQAVGRVDQVAKPGDYFAGCLLDDPYVVLRDGDGTLRAFHNVCRHHAAAP